MLYPGGLWTVTAALETLVDLICLVYHEARNVRHPIKKEYLAGRAEYRALASLPRNRVEAWASMAKVREKARKAGSGAAAARVFQDQFGLSLAQLTDLFRASFWKNSAYGGNRWAPICFKVRELVDALDSGDEGRVEQLLEFIPKMGHNTGIVEDKLKSLSKANHAR